MYLVRTLLFYSVIFACNMSGLLSANEKLEIHVAPTGHDGNPGTLAQPFRTLTMARDAIRQHKQTYGLPHNGAIVWIHSGTYILTDTFFLEAADSGTSNGPIIYSAIPNSTVKIVGGRDLPAWKPLDASCALQNIPAVAREHVRYINLKHLGITDFGNIMPRSAMRPMFPAALELFASHSELRIACWPNSGHALCQHVTQEHNAFLCDRAKNWSKLSDIYLHGAWLPEKCDSWECVKQIDLETGRIELQKQDPPVHLSQTTPYKVFNVLEELDSPGEWYLDRKTGMLYLWPNSQQATEYRISELNTLICCDNAQHIQFRDVNFECARVCGVEILDGHAIQLQHCHLQNFGNLAVTISGGVHHSVQHCHFAHTGDGAVRIEGGSEETQQPGHHTIAHCHFENYARSGLAYRPAVHVYGYSNRVTHNQIHKHAEPAILSFGSGHTISDNHEIVLAK